MASDRPGQYRQHGHDHAGCTGISTLVGSVTVGRYIDADDVIDAQGRAGLLGLAQRNTVSLYRRRHPSTPRPVIELSQGRCKLWLRSEVQRWRSTCLTQSAQ